MAFNLAFFGAGAAAQPYLAALRLRADVRVVACATPTAAPPSRPPPAAAPRSSPTLTLYSRSSPTPCGCVAARAPGRRVAARRSTAHPLLRRAAGAVDFAEAQQCARLVEEANLVTAVGFWARYADVAQERASTSASTPFRWRWVGGCAPGRTSSAPRRPPVGGRLPADRPRALFCGEVTRVRALSAGRPAAAWWCSWKGPAARSAS